MQRMQMELCVTLASESMELGVVTKLSESKADGDKHGGYANVETMEAFIASKQLSLVLEERNELIPRNASFDAFMGSQHADGDMIGMVFTKV